MRPLAGILLGATLCCGAGTEKLRFDAAARDAMIRLGVSGIEQCGAQGREKLPVPRIDAKVRVASATRAPWIIANGWRFLRRPGGRFFYELPPHKAVLALAEAFVYGADACFQIAPEDCPEAARMLEFLRALPRRELPPIADFAFVDDGSPLAAEAINLLSRRNLLFALVARPDPRYQLNVVIGSDEFPRSLAANPAELAAAVRQKLTDERRSVRLFGSEMAIVRATGDGTAARLYLLYYGDYPVRGLRLRVRGQFSSAAVHVFERPGAQAEELLSEGGFTELTIPETGPLAVVDLPAPDRR
jgi:hypothetical protein